MKLKALVLAGGLVLCATPASAHEDPFLKATTQYYDTCITCCVDSNEELFGALDFRVEDACVHLYRSSLETFIELLNVTGLVQRLVPGRRSD